MSEIKEAVSEIKSAVSQTKTETLSAVDQKLAELKSVADEQSKKLADEVKQLNEDGIKKGQTLAEINEEIKQLKANQGRHRTEFGEEVKSTQAIIAEGFAEHFEEIKSVRKGSGFKMEHKAVGTMTSANNSGGNVVRTISNIFPTRGRRRSRIRDLVDVIPTATGLWEYWRQPYNTIGEGSFGFQTTPGALKNQLDYDYERVQVTADYLAGFVVIAKQMLQDLPFMQSQVTSDLVEDYNRVESATFFNQLTAAATGNNTAAQTVYAEKIVQWIANLLEADREPTGIVTTASNWATLMNTKPSDYSLPGGGSVTIGADGTVYFLGMPVYVASQAYIGANRTLIGDFNYAKILQAEGLSTNIYEQDSDNVRRNLVTIKTEARVALAVLRTDAFIYGVNS